MQTTYAAAHERAIQLGWFNTGPEEPGTTDA
jgi:hypothetical protein